VSDSVHNTKISELKNQIDASERKLKEYDQTWNHEMNELWNCWKVEIPKTSKKSEKFTPIQRRGSTGKLRWYG
jgi:hypothetical protein